MTFSEARGVAEIDGVETGDVDWSDGGPPEEGAFGHNDVTRNERQLVQIDLSS